MPDETAATEAQLHLNRLQELPPLSLVSQRLLEALSDEDAGLDEVAEVIELDPALAARIVGVARSAFFGSSSTVFNVKDAIVRVLGLDMVRSLGLSISLGDTLSYDRVRGFDGRYFWTTSLLAADMSRYLAPRVVKEERPEADPAYLGGLLHDLGLLALAHLFPAKLSAALAAAEGAPLWQLADTERRFVGIDHHAAGGWLARRWHLPEAVIVVMENAHQPAYRGPLWPTSLLVSACGRWAEWRQTEGEGIPDSVLPDLELLGIRPRELDKVRDAFERKYEQTSQMAESLIAGR